MSRLSRWFHLHSILMITVCSGWARAENLQWHVEKNCRWADLSIKENNTKVGFTWLPVTQTGLDFTNAVDERATAANRILLNGAGLATGDFDDDGLVDLFLCSLSGGSKLYRNLGGFRFQDVTAGSGIVVTNGVARGAVFCDVNGDSRLDLLVSTLANGVQCFLNLGNGKFTDATASAGTASSFGSTTMALADIDGNGTLDLYVANYRGDDIRDHGQVNLMLVNGQIVVPPALRNRLRVVQGQVLEYGDPDQLFLNDGKGHFTPVPWTQGNFLDEQGHRLTEEPRDWGLTASFRDLNGDGFPDLYVCNDYWTPDRIWLNDGKGHFRALPSLALRETSSSSMGVDFADIDQDGHLDMMVTDMLSRNPALRKRQMPARWPLPSEVETIEARPQIIQNTLLHDRGDGTYEEIANFAGVAASDWTWQPLFLDVDLDGYPDLLVSAGHSRDVQDMDANRQIQLLQHSFRSIQNPAERQRAFTQELMAHMRLYPRLRMPIFAFRNTGQLRFEETTSSWGTYQPGVHHCIALADLDNDGDLDLVVNNLGDRAAIYRNDTAASRVAVRLRGLPPNTQGIGAEVTLLHGALPKQSQEITSGGRYMSGSDPEVVFGAGAHPTNMTLAVRWRSGRTSEIRAVAPNRLYEITEPPDAPSKPQLASSPPIRPRSASPLFEDVSNRIRHTHHTTPFDDFARQPLLPRKLSDLGPGVAWYDLNGDGWDDLIVGSGAGGQLAVFLNDGKGGFKSASQPPFTLPVTRDQTGVLGVTMPDGRVLILAGSSNYQDGLAIGSAVRQYDPSAKQIDDSIPGQLSSSGPLALADLNGDGMLELFVGGRCIPGRYPEAASSLLLRQTQGHWELDEQNTQALSGVGMVSGAVWSDLDGDGFPELVLACEWGPIRIFKNEHGRLREATAELGLAKETGWWNSVAVGDFDGDGRLDIVAGNWGLNSDAQASTEQPLRIYYGDWGGRGTLDLLEAEYDPGQRDFTPLRRLDALAPSLPAILARFSTVKQFSEGSISQVLGSDLSGAHFVEAKTLASVVFLNRGGRFELVELPREAQFAPVFGISVADFDGDGNEDLFLSQNFFGREPERPRMDAGRGLLLLGTGNGRFRAVPGQESGIEIYGEQRGSATADFDQDGRVDLVVAQYQATTKLFRNVMAKPGLRVRLIGPRGNSTGVGAVLRLDYGDRQGPAREIHAGAGYWGQDSNVEVLGPKEQARNVKVRWPGGKVTSTSLAGAGETLTVRFGD